MTEEKLVVYLFITCGHWPLDNALLVISATVFFRESGSWRETATGWRELKIAVKQIKKKFALY